MYVRASAGSSWKLARQQQFVKTLQKGLPCPNVVLRERQGAPPTLEDGQQRLTTAARYMNDKFANLAGKKFSELSLEEQFDIKRYPMPVLTYTNVSELDVRKIFDNFQNGVPLTVGERLHSLSGCSPLVQLTEELLLKPGAGFYDDFVPIWGHIKSDASRYKTLANAVALVAGLCFGTMYISKKWGDLADPQGEGLAPDAEGIIYRDISELAKRGVRDNLARILKIYRDVQAGEAITTKSDINWQWDLGNITGYIAYGLKKYPNADAQMARWTEYLVERRKAKAVHGGKISAALKAKEQLHDGIDAARSWKVERWELGYQRVFDSEKAKKLAAGLPVDDDSTETEE